MLNRNNKITLDTSGFSARDTLAETMEMYHITQTELAEHLGVSQAHISDILKYKKFMSSELAVKIEMATGIPAKFLLREDMEYQLEQLKKSNAVHSVKRYDWASA